MKSFVTMLLIAAAAIAVLAIQKRAPSRKMNGGRKDKPLLKRFGDLVQDDFKLYPVWVNAHVIDYEKDWYKETDEETFRPWDGSLPIDPAETMFLVKAAFSLADGTQLTGFITPQQGPGEPDLSILQPYLFTPSGELISFWFGLFEPTKEDVGSIYTMLGRKSTQVFPIRFQAEKGTAKGIVKGTISGFCRTGKNGQVIVER